MVGVFLFQAIGSTLVLSNYHINKDYITKLFCVNKKEVKMKCNGQCHLREQLKKTAEKENSPFSSVSEKQNINLYSSRSSVQQLSSASPITNPLFVNYSYSTSDRHLTVIFHPPQA